MINQEQRDLSDPELIRVAYRVIISLYERKLFSAVPQYVQIHVRPRLEPIYPLPRDGENLDLRQLRWGLSNGPFWYSEKVREVSIYLDRGPAIGKLVLHADRLTFITILNTLNLPSFDDAVKRLEDASVELGLHVCFETPAPGPQQETVRLSWQTTLSVQSADLFLTNVEKALQAMRRESESEVGHMGGQSSVLVGAMANAFTVDEDDTAIEDLVANRIVAEAEMGEAFAGNPASAMVRHKSPGSSFVEGRKVDRFDLLKNSPFLSKKASGPDAPSWFRSLYLWLAKHEKPWNPVETAQISEDHPYADLMMVLGSDGDLHEGKYMVFPDDPALDDLRLLSVVNPAYRTEITVHPAILDGVTDPEEKQMLREFLTSRAGVHEIDLQFLCIETMLNDGNIAANKPKPTPQKLIDETRVFCQIMRKQRSAIRLLLWFFNGRGRTGMWVLTKDNQIRPAKEVVLSSEYKPDLSWEWESPNGCLGSYSHLSPLYLPAEPKPGDLLTWRQFFKAVGVREVPSFGK